MSRPRSARSGATFLTAVLILAVLGAIASVFLWRHGIESRLERDRRAARRWASIRIESRLPDPRLLSTVRVGVLADSSSNRWFNGPAALDTITSVWLAALRAIGADARIVMPDDRASIRDVAVLVVPSSPCLGEGTRAAVDSVLARGGGVIATWLSGTRDAACADAGYHFITRLAEASRIDTLDRRAVTFVTLPDGGALAAGIPPGATFQVRSAHDGAVRRVGRDAYYSDGMLNPAPASAQPGLDGAVTHAVTGGGRAVYWGFDLARVVDRPWDRGLSRLLLRNAVAWAAGEPLVSLAPWPAGRRAAVIVVQDVDTAAGAQRGLDTVEGAAVKGTFFLATNTARDQRRLARQLASEGEVASRPDDELRIARTDEEQTDKFRSMRDELSGVLGRPVAGMMPPMERIDPLLALAWARAGGSYILAGNSARSASPELLTVDSASLVLLPRVADDDAAILRTRASSAGSLDDTYRASFGKLSALGGLYIMRHHASLLSHPDLVPVLARAIRAAAADSTVWVTTAQDVAGWWLARSRVSIATTPGPNDALSLAVVNGGQAPLAGAVLRIVPRDGERIAAVSGASVRDGSGETVSLLLPTLAPRSTHTVQLRFAIERGPHAR